MANHTFTQWLKNEVLSAKYALLTLLEKRDTMIHIERHQLEQEYMAKIGEYENKVLMEEMECELLEEKRQMVQTAINRREPVDEAAIDEVLNQKRELLMKEAQDTMPQNTGAGMSAGTNEELQKIYREIVEKFHPQTHPDLTDMQRILFAKAQEAYRMRNIESLRLIHDMLFSSVEEEKGLELNLSLELSAEGDTVSEKTYSMTDYTLVAMIYDGFIPTQEEAVIREEWSQYQMQVDRTMLEIDLLQQDFPFNAAELLSDPTQVEAYKSELEHRMRNAVDQRSRLTDEIAKMIERAKVYESSNR